LFSLTPTIEKTTTTKTIQKIYKSQGCHYVIVFHFNRTSSQLDLSIILNTSFSNTCNTDMQQASNHLHHSQSRSTNPGTWEESDKINK
jgi:hypothetical protein